MKKGICLHIFLLSALLTACDGPFPSTAKPSLPDDHTDSIKGVYHKAGQKHPYYESSGCSDSDCHQDDLDGGVGSLDDEQVIVPSCFQCHETLWEDDTEEEQTRSELFEAILNHKLRRRT